MYIYEDSGYLGMGFRIDAGKKSRPTLRIVHVGDGQAAVVVGDSQLVYGNSAITSVAQMVFDKNFYPQFLWNSVTSEEADDTAQPGFNWYFVDAKKYVEALANAGETEYLSDIDFVFDETSFEIREITGYEDETTGEWIEGEPYTVCLHPESTTGTTAYKKFRTTDTYTVHGTDGTAYTLYVEVSIDDAYVTTYYNEVKKTFSSAEGGLVAHNFYTASWEPGDRTQESGGTWAWGTKEQSDMIYTDVTFGVNSGITFNTKQAVTNTDFDKWQESQKATAQQAWVEAYNNNDTDNWYSDAVSFWQTSAATSQMKITTEGDVDGNVYVRAYINDGEDSEIYDYYFVPWSAYIYDPESIEEYYDDRDVVGFYTVQTTNDDNSGGTVRLYCDAQFTDILQDTSIWEKIGLKYYSVSVEYDSNETSAQSYKVITTLSPQNVKSDDTYNLVMQDHPCTQNEDGEWVHDTLTGKDDMYMKGHAV